MNIERRMSGDKCQRSMLGGCLKLILWSRCSYFNSRSRAVESCSEQPRIEKAEDNWRGLRNSGAQVVDGPAKNLTFLLKAPKIRQ